MHEVRDPRAPIRRPLRALILCLALSIEVGSAANGPQTLYRRLEGEPATLNPILETSELEEIVLANISRNLIDVDDHLKLVGGLCDRWKVSADQRTFTFHVRQEAVWEDGVPVTAHDAVITVRRIVDPAVPALRFSSGLEGLLNARELDAKTFQVEFAKPYALRLAAFHFGLLPAARYEHRPLLSAPENRFPVANGPYRFEKWRTGEEIILVRNENYWGPRSAFDRVIFRIVTDQVQAYRALVRGALDETRVSLEQARSAASDSQFTQCCRLLQFYDLSFFYLGYNHRNPLFRDAGTRRALTMLIDRQGIVDHLFGGAGRLLSGPWPAEMPSYDQSIPPYPFDPPQAQALLKKAGWRSSDAGLARGGIPFRFRLLYAASSNTSREVAEIVTANLARAGIESHPVGVEWAALAVRMEAGDFDAVLISWAEDVNPDLYESWHSSQAPPHGMNSVFYNNPAVDRLIEATRTEPDDARRLALFHQLHAIFHEDEPATWICQIAQRHAMARRIQGVATSPLGLFRYWPGATTWFPAMTQ